MSKLAVGTPAPDFSLQSHTGETIRLQDYRGRKQIVLVFNRGFF